MCQTGLSPGTPNGAPFSCLVGGGAGGRDGRLLGGLQIERVTERVQGRERLLDRQADGKRGTNNDASKQMRAGSQREGDHGD